MPTAVSPLATSLALTDRFLESFDFREDVDKESIDLSGAHSWDITAVHARDKVGVDFRREGIEVEVIGMNQATVPSVTWCWASSTTKMIMEVDVPLLVVR